jgi:uncharacterized repeat protein (TIGR02543 family)
MRKKNVRIGSALLLALMAALALILTACPQTTGNDSGGATNCTVIFNTGGGSAIAPVTVGAGSIVHQPADPAKEGFYFENWYTAETAGSVVNWPLIVNANITIYARWMKEVIPGARFTVTFDTGGGSFIDPVTVDAGFFVDRPADPTKEGFYFENWYTAEIDGSVVNWPLTVSENTTVYAWWTEAVIPSTQFTVTFDTGGGSFIDPVTVDAGSIVYQPADPSKEGYYFDDWYTAEIDGSAVNWPLTVSEDATVYARWIFTGQGFIQVTFSSLPQDETTSLTGMSDGNLSWTNGTLDISVPEENFQGASWQWYLDGVPLNGATTAALNKPGSDFSPGRHELTVEIRTADLKVYSKTLRFTVGQ